MGLKFKVEQVSSKVKHNWRWPLQFGFIKTQDNEGILNEFDHYHWLKTLSNRYFLSYIRKSCNVLILNGSMHKIIESINSIPYTIKVDLLILFVKGKFVEIPPVKIQKLLMGKIHANSIFGDRCKADFNPLSWADEFVFRLSHNANIASAIESFYPSGRLLITNALKNEGKLEVVFSDYLDKLKTISKYANYDESKIFTPDVVKRLKNFAQTDDIFTLQNHVENLKDLQAKIDRFEYLGETHESMVIKDVLTSGSAQESDFLEKIDQLNANPQAKSVAERRYLQFIFQSTNGKSFHHALLINSMYLLKIKIDAFDPEWIQGGNVTNHHVPITYGQLETIQIAVSFKGNIITQDIYLRNSGASTEANFPITINTEGEHIFEIFAYHKSRLIQQISVSVFFCSHEDEIMNMPPLNIEFINMPRSILSDLDKNQEFESSLITSPDPMDFRVTVAKNGKIVEYELEQDIKQFNNKIKSKINSYLENNDVFSSDLKDKVNNSLILYLAKQGSLFYKNFFDDYKRFEKPIQIISKSSSYIPIELLYTKKITKKTKEICPKASESLLIGRCGGCEKEEGEYICPFGFVSLSTVIERHEVGVNTKELEKGGFGLYSEPSAQKRSLNLFNNILFGTGDTLEAYTKGLRKEVALSIQHHSKKSEEAHSWSEWEEKINKLGPDSLIIVGHVEPEKKDTLQQLEIGNDLLEINLIDGTHVQSSRGIRKNPLVIVIGCSTQQLDQSFLDFNTRFKKEGASIVLSNFTKIRGRHAGPLIKELFEILKKLPNKTFSFGEIVLRLRQILFSQGILVSLTMVSHGDADWQIKIK